MAYRYVGAYRSQSAAGASAAAGRPAQPVLLLLLLAGSGGTFSARATPGGVLAGHDVDEEVEHVGLGQGGGDVGALQRAALVLLGVDPGAHGELGDEDVAALGEEDGCFG